MLTKFVSVYVPSTRHAVPISRAEHDRAVRSVESAFSREFGGFTATPGVGGWLSDSKGLITEPVTIVKSYYTEDKAASALKIAQRVAKRLKKQFDQEAVSLETEQGLEFV